MSVDPSPLQIFLNDVWFLFKIGFIAFGVAYFLFSLVVVRQVSLMTETLITEVSLLLRILAILFALLSLGILVLFIVFI